MISATLFSTRVLFRFYIEGMVSVFVVPVRYGYGPQLVKRDLKFSVHASDDWHLARANNKNQKKVRAVKKATHDTIRSSTKHNFLFDIYVYIYIYIYSVELL